MKINKRSIEDFGGVFISFLPVSTDLVSNIIIGEMNHIDNGLEVKTQTRELVVLFEKEFQMSYFTKELIKKFVIDHEEYIYDCLLLTTPEIMHIGRCVIEVTYRMSAIRKKPLIVNNDTSFIVEGTYKTDCIYEITSQKSIETFTVDGYTIYNLKANKKFIIDGINKLVYYADTPEISAFDDVDIIEFPELELGNHVVQKSDPDVVVLISYYPVYL